MKYFSSDHHIGHDNILHLGEGRPFGSTTHMAQAFRNNIFSKITDEDEFYCMGDEAMGNFEENIEFFRDLPGKKFLIPGNHDKIGATQTRVRNERFKPLYEAVGFTVLPDVVTLQFDVSWGVQDVLASHYPYSEAYVRGGAVDKFSNVRPVNEGLPLLHGHTHSNQRFDPVVPLQFHIGVDANDWSPVSETEIIAWLEDLRVRGLI